MAEIHVQAKKRGMPGWIWIVLGLLILGAIAYVILVRSNKIEQKNTTNQSSPSSFVQPLEEYNQSFLAI